MIDRETVFTASLAGSIFEKGGPDNMYQPDAEIKELRESVESELDGLGLLSKEDKETKNADIKDMIRYYLSMTQDMDARLTKWHDVGLQVLGISLAAFGVLLTQYREFGFFLFGKIVFVQLLLVLILLAGASFLICFLYGKQQSFNKYPFNMMPESWNQWKWFYYGNRVLLEISTGAVVRRRSSKKTVIPFLKGAKEYFSKYRQEDLDGELKSNLKQLYIHQVLNYYKNRWFLQLAWVWRYTVYLVPVALLIGLLLAPVLWNYVTKGQDKSEGPHCIPRATAAQPRDSNATNMNVTTKPPLTPQASEPDPDALDLQPESREPGVDSADTHHRH